MTVELDRISKSFGPLTVLHELSLTVAPGEFMVLLGPVRLRQDHGLAHDRRAGERHHRAASASTAAT